MDTKTPTTTASPAGGTYGSAQIVTLSSNEQATIYYTTNGTDAEELFNVYSDVPISLTANTTLKYFAKDPAENVETINSQIYTIYLNGIPGDLNGDEGVTLADAIIALQAITDISPQGLRSNYPTSTADVNGDSNVGISEALYILQKVAGMR